jgi:hypothetical protein
MICRVAFVFKNEGSGDCQLLLECAPFWHIKSHILYIIGFDIFVSIAPLYLLLIPF